MEQKRDPFVRILQGTGILSAAALFGMMAVFLLGLAAVAGAFNYFTSDLPDFTDLSRLGRDIDATFETTKVYAWGEDEDNDGNRDVVLIYEILDPFGGDRSWIPYSVIPDSFIDATVAIEDKTFWENRGFDVEGITRAFYQYIIAGGNVQGGSSITQQVVKNNLIEEERRVVGAEIDLDDYRRKAEELVLSSRISNVYTKEQIMEWYLNTNFYGNLAYGIEAAARVYYDKQAKDLTLGESAMLAAVPQSPAFNPINNLDLAKTRQELVLQSMFREGFIDRATLLEALEEDVSPERTDLETRYDIISPHFAIYVREQLEKKFGQERVLRGGLQVYTTLDLVWQRNAECVARAQVAQLSKEPIESVLGADEIAKCDALDFLQPVPAWGKNMDHEVNNAAVVMIDPRTAEIRAMVGSIDYWDDDIDGRFNVAADGLRQPGSSFKPFTYLTALQQGYTAASMTLDVETDLGTPYNGIPYSPENYDREFHGPMRMRKAFANSYNVPAVEVMTWVGVERVIRTAHKLGVTTLDDAQFYGLPLTLGGGEVKLLDMTYAFGAFANRGRMVGEEIPEDAQRLGYRTLDPVSILRVTDNRGNMLYEYNQPKVQQVITEQEAFIMADIMSDKRARCEAFGCPNFLELPDDRPVAAKTGTTNEYRDAWTIGYTPQLVTGVWVGNTGNTEMKEAPGSLAAAPIWQAVMTWALQNEPAIGWEPPGGVREVEVCELNGLRPGGNCPTVNEWFIDGTEPTTIDNMHQKFRIDSETGELATAATPPDRIVEETIVVYPDSASDWARATGRKQPPGQINNLTQFSFVAGNTAILSPQPFDIVRGAVPIVGNAKTPIEFSYWNLSIFPTSRPSEAQFIDQYRQNPVSGWDLGTLTTANYPDGEYTLLLQVYNKRNVVAEEFRTQITVDNANPSATMVFPLDGQEYLENDEWVLVQAQAIDGVGIDRVEFFIDGKPFASRSVPPFTQKWTIDSTGCHSFHVVTYDQAGNSARSGSRRACVSG